MFDIVRTTEDWVAIQKHPGISCHKDGGQSSLIQEIRDELSMPELHQVHRLDKGTSGLMIFARGPDAARELSEGFAQGEIGKYYIGLGTNKPRKKQGSIIGDMYRSRRGSWKLSRNHNNPAVTSFFSKSTVPGQRLYLMRPLTGRTHQLRVAMKSVGAPMIGDTLYGFAEEERESDRMYLHCYALRFRWQGEDIELRALPTEGSLFQVQEVITAIEEWSEPWTLKWPKVKVPRQINRDFD